MQDSGLHRRVQFLWVGKPLGLMETLSLRSFQASGHDVHLYVYDGVTPPSGVILKDANEIVPRARIFAHQRGIETGSYTGFSDLFRYRLLYEKGGWWCDLDMVCLKPLPAAEGLLVSSENHWLFPPRLCIGAMFAQGGEAGLKLAYEMALDNDPRKLRFAGNGVPLLVRAMKKSATPYSVARPWEFNPVGWWRSQDIVAEGSAAAFPKNSYTLHCYTETWRRRLKDRFDDEFRNKHFPEDTLLGSLQKKYL